MRVLAFATVLVLATPAAADVAFVRGGPKPDAARAATAAIDDIARRDMTPCWRRGGGAVEVALTVNADGAVASAAARTDGAVAQCVAGILAVAELPKVAWTGVVSIGPAAMGGGGDDVGAELGKHGAQLKACQQSDVKAAGVVEIDMRVHADGSITDVAVSRSLSPALDACLLGVLKGLKLDGYRGKEVRYRLGLQYAGGDVVTHDRGAPTPPEPSGPSPTKRGPLEVFQIEPVVEGAHLARCGNGLGRRAAMVARFTIRKDGTVKNLGVKVSLGDAKVEACVLDAISKLQFPTATDETQVQLPVAFAP